MLLGLGLLETEHIRVILLNEGEQKALFMDSTNAIDVPGYDSHELYYTHPTKVLIIPK